MLKPFQQNKQISALLWNALGLQQLGGERPLFSDAFQESDLALNGHSIVISRGL